MSTPYFLFPIVADRTNFYRMAIFLSDVRTIIEAVVSEAQKFIWKRVAMCRGLVRFSSFVSVHAAAKVICDSA